MLSLYQSFVVPEVPHVQIYRDDEDPHQFYMVSERASVARDDEGKPLFTFLLYARDVDRLAPEDREVQRGFMQITTQAAVTKSEEDKIRQYLRQKLRQERSGGLMFLWNRINKEEPQLGYPPLWLDGKVEFSALPPSMVPYSAGSKVPSLINTNLASFSAELSQDGAELFRQAVEKQVIPAGVWYNLEFAARIPAITIRIRGNKGDFYNEVKNYVRKRYESTHTKKIFGITYYKRRYVYEWDELASITKFRNTFHSLTVEVDSGSLPATDQPEMQDKLEEMAFSILQTNVLPNFFDTAIQEVTAEEGAAAGGGTGVPINTVNTGTINIDMTRRQIVAKKANPSAILSEALTPEEVKKHTIYVDLSQPFFQELDVTVNANVNFQADPVFGLKVFLDYDQQDEVRNVRVKRAKEILFRNSDQVGRFRQIMAKGRDGAPKDSYRYWSEISYKDTGETIRVPRSGAIESRERQLVISYRRLGFVKVNLVLGTMPESVRVVEVKMRYPGYSGPSGQQSFELTKDKPNATFFTYTGQSGEPGPYRYQVSYVLTDGQRMDVPEQSGQSEMLTIQDPFEQSATARFLAQADFGVVQKIIVDAQYRDDEHDFAVDHHAELVENGETSAWSFGLRDPNKREYQYVVTIIYRNGSRSEQPPKTGTLGATIPVGEGAVDALEVTIIASTADWARYKLVLAYLKYDDEANSVHAEKNFTFRPESNDDQTWKVLLRDRQRKAYQYRLRYVGVDAADNREVAWQPSEEPVLVIE